jgi:hypothetical protein
LALVEKYTHGLQLAAGEEEAGLFELEVWTWCSAAATHSPLITIHSQAYIHMFTESHWVYNGVYFKREDVECQSISLLIMCQAWQSEYLHEYGEQIQYVIFYFLLWYLGECGQQHVGLWPVCSYTVFARNLYCSTEKLCQRPKHFLLKKPWSLYLNLFSDGEGFDCYNML